MLTIKNLNAGYDGMQILENVNVNIKPGEIVSFIGPNGAGKSTLLKSIFNLCDVYSGKIIFNKNNITKMPTHDLIIEGISFVPQGRPIFSDLTVKENLEMGLYAFHNKEFITTKIKEVFNRFPVLEKKKDQLAYSLSGGQQQILAIARSLMHEPKLLLLDEPSLGLDPKTMKQIFNIVQELNKEGITIMIVEQNAKQATSISDRTYILEDGKIKLEGGKDILQNKKIKEIYFGGR